MVNDLNKPCAKKRQRQLVYANMCKYLTKNKKKRKESSCQQRGPAGRGLKINRIFLTVKLKILLLPQEFLVDMCQ